MKHALVIAIAFACRGAFASEPGQPLDCSDWVFVEPGLSYSYWHVNPCPANDPWCFEGRNPAATDNIGRAFRRVDVPLPAPCPVWSGTLQRRELRAFDGTTETLVAYIEERCSERADLVRWAFPSSGYLFLEQSGKLVLPTMNSLGCAFSSCPTGDSYWVPVLSGFATTFDVLQTYTPQADLGFRVPYMPEGMAGADHFDTYWGQLTKPIDFTHAHPLQCDYPASPPAVGDYLSVPDTVPMPAPGQGVYYLTSATYQGATRYGRKTTAGQLSGRDPALLPACSTVALPTPRHP